MEIENRLDFCLLIPCYNNYEGLIRSLKSIAYPADKYLILIVDDGSAKKIVEEDIESDLQRALPLKVLHMVENSGITKALNFGLNWTVENVNCAYVARLDCGDSCDTRRFELQVEVMNSDKALVLIGSWCRFENKNGVGYNYITPIVHDQILRSMNFRNIFIHPTVMFRLSTVKEVGYYPENFEFAEDYAYFWRLIQHGKSMVINKILVTCEIAEGGISFSNKGKQLVARWRVVNRYSSSWGLQAAGYIRLLLLFIVPKRLALYLKKWKG